MPAKQSASSQRAAQTRRPPKGIKAGNGAYLFQMTGLNSVDGGPDYSTAKGSLVEGERSMIGLMRMPRGTGAAAHSHPNEQWVYIIEGELAFEVDGVKGVARAGSLLYFPPNAVHGTLASKDRDVVFLTGKDNSHGLWGTPVKAKASHAKASAVKSARPKVKSKAAPKRKR